MCGYSYREYVCPGMQFWKVGSRKIYAVRNSELRSVAKPSKGKHPLSLTLDSDSSDDAFMQYSKKGKFVSNKVLRVQRANH